MTSERLESIKIQRSPFLSLEQKNKNKKREETLNFFEVQPRRKSDITEFKMRAADDARDDTD